MEYLGGWQCQKGKRGGMTSMFCRKHPFTWCILLCGAASGQLWLKIWERRNKNSFCWYLQRLKTRSCKDSDLTEFERTVVLQNDYINRMLSFTVWSLCACVCVCVANIAVWISLYRLWSATMPGSNSHETVLSGCPRARSIWAAH